MAADTQPRADIFAKLSKDELERVEPVSREAVRTAIDQGRQRLEQLRLTPKPVRPDTRVRYR